MKKSSKNIASTVAELLTPTISELGYEVWDVEYVKEGSEYYLRITIDNDKGIDIEDCEKVHRAIDPLLDEADPIEDAYHLEVSSPGIERELKYDWHFDVFMGETVEIKLFAPINGAKSALGVLTAYSDDAIVLTVGENEISYPREKISKISLYFDFNDIENFDDE